MSVRGGRSVRARFGAVATGPYVVPRRLAPSRPPWPVLRPARQRRAWQDAAQREEDLVEGRAVYRIVWLITVTAPTADGLEAAAGQVEAAARRCSLELRRLAGSQRQAFAFTLPLCRGAR